MRLTVRRISGNLTKEANPIEEYKPVKSTWEISKRIADCLEDYAPQTYPHSKRTQTINESNEILQGRSDRAISSLFDEVKRTLGVEGAELSASIIAEVNAFVEQRRMLDYPYTKTSDNQYLYETLDLNPERPLKIINQQLYDQAAKDGFPRDFFRQAFFDRVTLYCLPDNADCSLSTFNDCVFAVCRIYDVSFAGASVYSSEFHSCVIEFTGFYTANLAHTHFHDCNIASTNFIDARLKSCNTRDCTMASVNYGRATLDGCHFDRVQAYDIRNLHTATITMGGATDEEVEYNRKAIYAALRPESKERQPLPHKKRETR